MKFKGFCAALLLSLPGLSQADDINVVTSVKPLQLIAAAVLGELAQPQVLIPPGASPHHYALKPSDRRKLAQADLLMWVGPDLELFLQKSLVTSQVATLTLLPEDEHADESAAEHAAHENEAEPEHADEHEGHDHDGVDPHLWLDPMQALQAAQQLTARLSQLYPQHQAQLEANLLTFSRQLIKVDQQLAADLLPLQSKGFFVFHDAYGRFMDRYQLKMLGAFTVDPGRPVGTRHLSDIRDQLQANAAVCVFGEPQFKAAVVKAVIDDLPVGYGELDPLALDADVSPQGYTEYLQQLGNQVSQCLKTGALATH